MNCSPDGASASVLTHYMYTTVNEGVIDFCTTLHASCTVYSEQY